MKRLDEGLCEDQRARRVVLVAKVVVGRGGRAVGAVFGVEERGTGTGTGDVGGVGAAFEAD